MVVRTIERAPVPVWQNDTEFGLFLDFIKARQPKRILEIGAFYGGTLWHWTQLKPEVLVSVDLITEEEPHASDIPAARSQWASWMEGIYFLDLVGPSTDWYISEQAREAAPYDFIFIDGDHRYEGVRRDFAMYLPMLASGGVVAFHDTVRHEPGVIQFMAELTEVFPTVRFFSPDWGAGITVVLP